ncbi:MAG: alkaline phosphatase D family protein [Pirellulaceae bacterium]
MSNLHRRRFLQHASTVGAGLAMTGQVASSNAAAADQATPAKQSAKNVFQSDWKNIPDRVWLGPEFWSNPLQDWRIAGGRLECTNAAPDRNVHLLTRQLAQTGGMFEMSVKLGRVDGGALGGGKGSAGFRIGMQGPLAEYRNSVIYGNGINAGVSTTDGLFLGQSKTEDSAALLDRDELELRLSAEPDDKNYRVVLSAHAPGEDKALAEVSASFPAARLVGNVALVANFPGPQQRRPRGANRGPGADRFWFADWRVAGDRFDSHDEQVYGPILFSQYTLSHGVMKLTAQMPPIGEGDSQTVQLQIKQDGAWKKLAEEKIHPEARTATFRIEDWDTTKDWPYRLAYTQKYNDGAPRECEWTGVIRRDPVDKPNLNVADVSCNIHAAFPNHEFVAKMAALNPDLIAFTGDQFYESTGGYGVQRTPLAPSIIDYLRKWYLHGWTWRELTKDRPSVSIPDDHDVYQGNIWGEGGAGKQATQEMGGYGMHPTWVNVVHRTQTSHHPDAYDPRPIKQGIIPYYGAMTYGRISFAILADRMFKTGPEGEVPPTGGRGDHVKDPDFDPKSADLPGLELLGEGQMKFLREWAGDLRGAEMKAVISQTIFTAMATTHGQGRERLRADYDANGWPQTARDEALRQIRKAFAVHLAGDQHLPAVVHYGIDAQRDAGVAFAGPAVNVGYPRWFEPEEPGKNRQPGAPENTGEFLDHFGNFMTVRAVANGAVKPRDAVLERMHDKTSGLGLVRFDKPNRRITIDCWPYLADPLKVGTQFAGWPVVVDMLENYGRKAAAHLPTLRIAGLESPVVQVVNEKTKEVEYTLRLTGDAFRPHVFDADAAYTLHIGDPDTGDRKTLKGVRASQDETIDVTF